MPSSPLHPPAAAPAMSVRDNNGTALKVYGTLAALTLALLLPFLNKAIHIDDPLFVWTARQISAHPGNPYGFWVNWYSRIDPMYKVTENPPLTSYYLAGAAALLGWSEAALHAAMALPAVGVVLGTCRLARRFAAPAVPAALFVLAAPVFLLSSTTLMCDVLMLCFWVWAIELWLGALDAPSGWRAAVALIFAGLLVAAAALSKYFGAALIPLLLMYTLARRRPLPVVALLIPAAVLTAYQLWTRHLYGHGLLIEPVMYVAFSGFQRSRPLGLTLLNLTAFTGGCLLPAMLSFPFLISPRVRRAVLALCLVVLVALAWDSSGLVMALRDNSGRLNLSLAVQLAVFSAGGVGVFILVFQSLLKRLDANDLLLGAWILGTLIFTGFFNWAINGRSILPMAPPVAILLARQWNARKISAPQDSGPAGAALQRPASRQMGNRLWLAPLGVSAVIALAAAWADQSVANVNRAAAHQITEKYATPGSRLWFEGHWGFQYYAQKNLSIEPTVEGSPSGGFRYIVPAGAALPFLYGEDGNEAEFRPGDVVAIALNNSGIRPMPEDYTQLREEFVRPVTPWLSVHSGFTGAGFYADVWGSAPFVFGPSMHEQYTILKVIKPMLGIYPSASPAPRSVVRVIEGAVVRASRAKP